MKGLFFTLVASETRKTLIMVPCSDAVAMYIPLEERTIAAKGARWASICNLNKQESKCSKLEDAEQYTLMTNI